MDRLRKSRSPRGVNPREADFGLGVAVCRGESPIRQASEKPREAAFELHRAESNTTFTNRGTRSTRRVAESAIGFSARHRNSGRRPAPHGTRPPTGRGTVGGRGTVAFGAGRCGCGIPPRNTRRHLHPLERDGARGPGHRCRWRPGAGSASQLPCHARTPPRRGRRVKRTRTRRIFCVAVQDFHHGSYVTLTAAALRCRPATDGSAR